MLREDHPVFQSPSSIDFSKTVDIKVPSAWKREITAPTVRVLPLVDGDPNRFNDGWCTYTYEHLQAPELEIISGGVNSKTVKASGIWRQGNLLHFGFEPSPAGMNENGRAMLANSIAYIARFRDSRPIIRRSRTARFLDRGAIGRLLKNQERELAPYLKWFFGKELQQELSGKTRAELAEWYAQHRDYLSADEEGKFFVDRRVQQLGVPLESNKFLPAAIAALQADDQQKELGRSLLQRYVGIGPGEDSSPDRWSKWWKENEDYLFFSDSGGFRWYIDSLAKKRGVPTGKLKGLARAGVPK